MARHPTATWDPLPSSSGGAFTGGPFKAVAHKTQGDTYAGARATYVSRSLGPHFTIGEEGQGAILYQHLDTNEASSAVANLSGGVQTNRDGAIQVEVVGFSSIGAGPLQLRRFVELQVWLSAQHGIPRIWPMGRPPKNSQTGYGTRTPYRDPAVWDTTPGWYGHSQVPENTHWDPAWTDQEWAVITAGEEDDDMDANERQMLAEIHQATRTPWGVSLTWVDHARIENAMKAVVAGQPVADVDEEELVALMLAGLDDAMVTRIAKAAADEADRRERERLGG